MGPVLRPGALSWRKDRKSIQIAQPRGAPGAKKFARGLVCCELIRTFVALKH
jgi:hypothetical protein